MEESTMKKHVTLVAALQIGFSTIGLIGAIVIFFVFNFAGSFVENDEAATMILNFLGTALPLAIGCVSVIGLIGGIGLLSYQEWARILVTGSCCGRLSECAVRYFKGSLFHLGIDAG